MIVVGVDPGGRDTGIVVINTSARSIPGMLLRHFTVTNPAKDLLDTSPAYLMDVNASILMAIRETDAEAVGMEGLRAPSSHIRGEKSFVRPRDVMAVALVVGSILGRSWPVGLVKIAPGGNGKTLPRTQYPEAIRMAEGGRGSDKRRHERSAFDVARQVPWARAIAAKR